MISTLSRTDIAGLIPGYRLCAKTEGNPITVRHLQARMAQEVLATLGMLGHSEAGRPRRCSVTKKRP